MSHELRIGISGWRYEPWRGVFYRDEVRSLRCTDPAFIALLREHSIACVVADAAGTWPMLEAQTSDFTYVRLHGDKQLPACSLHRALKRPLLRPGRSADAA